MGDWTMLFFEPIYSLVDLALDRPITAAVTSFAIAIVLFVSFVR